DIPNNEDKFGYQIVVDEAEEIVYTEERLLWSALPFSLDELYTLVHEYQGLFIPAHIDKPSTSIMSQLGFVPPDIKADALELSKFTSPEMFIKRFAYLKKFSFFQSSDAHIESLIGETYSWFLMENLSFSELRKAFRGEDGRRVYCGTKCMD
ncbi:MAG: histidinol-phosphatase, partial [Bacteroidales bacterium]